MIEAQGLTKRYGNKLAVDQLSFQVRPGTVTGFLGPNGAGKSTTMRMILGLDSPTAGNVLVNGRPYEYLSAPLREVGALLDAKAMHGGRSAYNHLLCLAQSNGIPRRRVDDVLNMVGITAVAKKRTKGFSLGMGQRLGIASALLGDPGILMFDEPVNGLDPEGILWIRNLMKALAAEGRTVFVSSHLMSEMEVTADHLIVIGQGRLIADTSMRDFIERNSQAYTVVRSPQADQLTKLVTAKGGTVTPEGDSGALRVTGPEPAAIGDMAAEHGIRLHELSPRFASLEEVYMRLTQGAVEYRAGLPGGPGAPGAPQGWGQPQPGWGQPQGAPGWGQQQPQGWAPPPGPGGQPFPPQAPPAPAQQAPTHGSEA
ncbi:ATP-binding cassette domain-containing protein [Yinghuangia sp. KLBMP8922]|uniref:ATP-binding cassette domain-containing protein n=2 Tax=Yinghuangia soli TaxID=2908204 RepID=A0AA41Q4Y1_9ACTN|nr:ATP-binding cassette domain-containing protein [Yinghuangia soli]MCF2531416.1 ATP-binding cassette domain-containing protein [Yinghuangia soli]